MNRNINWKHVLVVVGVIFAIGLSIGLISNLQSQQEADREFQEIVENYR